MFRIAALPLLVCLPALAVPLPTNRFPTAGPPSVPPERLGHFATAADRKPPTVHLIAERKTQDLTDATWPFPQFETCASAEDLLKRFHPYEAEAIKARLATCSYNPKRHDLLFARWRSALHDQIAVELSAPEKRVAFCFKPGRPSGCGAGLCIEVYKHAYLIDKDAKWVVGIKDEDL